MSEISIWTQVSNPVPILNFFKQTSDMNSDKIQNDLSCNYLSNSKLLLYVINSLIVTFVRRNIWDRADIQEDRTKNSISIYMGTSNTHNTHISNPQKHLSQISSHKKVFFCLVK